MVTIFGKSFNLHFFVFPCRAFIQLNGSIVHVFNIFYIQNHSVWNLFICTTCDFRLKVHCSYNWFIFNLSWGALHNMQPTVPRVTQAGRIGFASLLWQLALTNTIKIIMRKIFTLFFIFVIITWNTSASKNQNANQIIMGRKEDANTVI